MDARQYIEGRTVERELESPMVESPAWSRRRTLLQAALWLPVLLFGAWAALQWSHRPRYPYGPSHCCDKGLMSTLRSYADTHDGWFPKGESTPEASLSLLYRFDRNVLYALPGKTVPESTVRTILESGRLLDPTTCGWHYVEGLRTDDDGQLGLFWDKAGLGHNGEYLREGGHLVGRVAGHVDYVRGNDWPAFLAEQAELHKKLKREPKAKAEVVE